MQVENLTRKAQLQEVELERTTKQLKEALAFAAGEATKCNAAKEVIKSLTAQVSCVFLYVMESWLMELHIHVVVVSDSRLKIVHLACDLLEFHYITVYCEGLHKKKLQVVNHES